MKIPYGISDFEQIRTEGFFYADKTPARSSIPPSGLKTRCSHAQRGGRPALGVGPQEIAERPVAAPRRVGCGDEVTNEQDR